MAVAVVTRRRGVRALVVVAAAFPLLLAEGAALLTVMIGGLARAAGSATPLRRWRSAPSPNLPADLRAGGRALQAALGDPGRDRSGGMRSGPPAGSILHASTGGDWSGIANFAGASGPMQIGVGGLAGDEYQSLRHYLPDPSLGPHDPTTAVELAALVLVKDKGAPTSQPIDAYAVYVRAYNGSGPAADAYAARVLADADAYRAPGRRRSGLRAARRSARRSCRERGEDPAERRCGRSGRRAGCRSADDRGR